MPDMSKQMQAFQQAAEQLQGEAAHPPARAPRSQRLPRHQQRNLISEGAIPTLLAAAVPFTESVGVVGFHDWLAVFLRDAGDPSDPVLRMLLQQIAFAHFRVALLHARAQDATQTDAADVYMAAASKLTAEFRRLVLTLADYRNASGSGESAGRPAPKGASTSQKATRTPARRTDQSQGDGYEEGAAAAKGPAAATAAPAHGQAVAPAALDRAGSAPDSSASGRQSAPRALENHSRDIELVSNKGAVVGPPRPKPAESCGRAPESRSSKTVDAGRPATIAGGGPPGPALAPLHGSQVGRRQSQVRRKRAPASEVGAVGETAPGTDSRRQGRPGDDDGGPPSGRRHRRRVRRQQVTKNP
jgi:hypothetical protein